MPRDPLKMHHNCSIVTCILLDLPLKLLLRASVRVSLRLRKDENDDEYDDDASSMLIVVLSSSVNRGVLKMLVMTMSLCSWWNWDTVPVIKLLASLLCRLENGRSVPVCSFFASVPLTKLPGILLMDCVYDMSDIVRFCLYMSSVHFNLSLFVCFRDYGKLDL